MIKNKPNWERTKKGVMYNIYSIKLNQHPSIIQTLKHTYLRPIIFNSLTDNFWGIGREKNGKNELGILLKKLREHYFKKI